MYRLDIQGLRAVAVGLVLVYHLFPTRLSGGFIGVDIFFVISGYLITAHMLREVAKTGSLSLTMFWARRIRRLLPASFLVLLVTAGAAYLWLPMSLWPDTFKQISASALYVVNWVLATDAVGYLTAETAPTAVQHYWSLSVEEQFYIIWPLLLLAVLAITKLSKQDSKRLPRNLGMLLGVIFVASLAYSVYRTNTDAAWAFYDTATRAWEFAAGGLLAILVTPKWASSRWSVPVGWLGLGAIVLAGFTFSASTLFPGWAALLPVGGAAAVLLCGQHPSRGAVGTLLRWRPAVFLGDISYAVYLWHWPLIIIGPTALGRELSFIDKSAIAVITILLATASTYLIENPLRYGSALRPQRRAFIFALLGALILALVYFAVSQKIDRIVAETGQEVRVSQSSCEGPGALDPRNNCDSPLGTGDYLIAPEIVAQPNFNNFFPDCQQGFEGTEPVVCEIGANTALGERISDSSEPDAHIAIVGDSHAGHWFFGFHEAGRDHNWRISTFAKTSCPPTLASRVLDSEQTTERLEQCAGWQENVLAQLAASETISTVVVSSFSSAYNWGQPVQGTELADPAVDGFAEFFSQIADQGKQVLVIKAVPTTNGIHVSQCLTDNPGFPMNCAAARADALPVDPMASAVAKLNRPEVRLINLDEQFCGAEVCYPVVGDIVVFRDKSHLSSQYSQALMPWVIPAVQRALDTATTSN